MLRLAAPYAAPSLFVSLRQLHITFLLFFLALAGKAWFLGHAYWHCLPFDLLAGSMLLRIFIIQHDCGHGSFFTSKRWNDWVGSFCSIFTLVPYYYWRRQHAIHHASNGNLDHRGHGDIDLLTVSEYRKLSKREKLRYRIHRNPLVFMLIGPIYFVCVINRFAFDADKSTPAERKNVYLTNLLLITLGTIFCLIFGIKTTALFLLPILYIAAAGGIWLFYIQHQFEHTYWEHDEKWDYVVAAMQGGSFYKLPKWLQWISGSIGYHHIHHLKPSIPNYRLQECHEENPVFQEAAVTITLWSSFKALLLSLWDENQKRLISFREYKRLYGQS